MQHRYFGKYASYYLFSVAYHKIPLAQLTLLASRINAPQHPLRSIARTCAIAVYAVIRRNAPSPRPTMAYPVSRIGASAPVETNYYLSNGCVWKASP